MSIFYYVKIRIVVQLNPTTIEHPARTHLESLTHASKMNSRLATKGADVHHHPCVSVLMDSVLAMSALRIEPDLISLLHF